MTGRRPNLLDFLRRLDVSAGDAGGAESAASSMRGLSFSSKVGLFQKPTRAKRQPRSRKAIAEQQPTMVRTRHGSEVLRKEANPFRPM